MLPFSKGFVFKMFSVYSKMQSRRFQIPPVCTAFSKSSFLWRTSVDGRPNRRLNKAAFSNLSDLVWTGRKNARSTRAAAQKRRIIKRSIRHRLALTIEKNKQGNDWWVMDPSSTVKHTNFTLVKNAVTHLLSVFLFVLFCRNQTLWRGIHTGYPR